MVTYFLDDRPATQKWFDMHWRPQNPCILSRMIIIIYKRQRERIVKQRKNRIFYQTNKENCVIIYLWKREPEQSLVRSGNKALTDELIFLPNEYYLIGVMVRKKRRLNFHFLTSLSSFLSVSFLLVLDLLMAPFKVRIKKNALRS